MIYYDSMTADGEMDWQNALTDQNENVSCRMKTEMLLPMRCF